MNQMSRISPDAVINHRKNYCNKKLADNMTLSQINLKQELIFLFMIFFVHYHYNHHYHHHWHHTNTFS